MGSKRVKILFELSGFVLLAILFSDEVWYNVYLGLEKKGSLYCINEQIKKKKRFLTVQTTETRRPHLSPSKIAYEIGRDGFYDPHKTMRYGMYASHNSTKKIYQNLPYTNIYIYIYIYILIEELYYIN